MWFFCIALRSLLQDDCILAEKPILNGKALDLDTVLKKLEDGYEKVAL